MPLPVRRLLLGAPVGLVIGAALVYQAARRDTRAVPGTAAVATASSAPKPGPAGSAELALTAPLAPGSDVGGFVVREIRAVEQGRLRVVCAKGTAIVRLEVALADPEPRGGALPPATAGRYAIYYGIRGATPEDGERLAKALAHVIEANASAPPPPGMTTFTPESKPGTAL